MIKNECDRVAATSGIKPGEGATCQTTIDFDGIYRLWDYHAKHNSLPFCCCGICPCSECDVPKLGLCSLVDGGGL